MHLASIVSERFGFAIPRGYVRMTEAGLLSQGRATTTTDLPAKKTAKKTKKKASSAKKKRKPASAVRALAVADIQWLNAQEIAARIERHGGRLLRWPGNFVFVPFAENLAGDQWGWAPSLGEPGANEPPILFLGYDSSLLLDPTGSFKKNTIPVDARIVAPTFATFLFRMTLESLAQCSHLSSEMSLTERIAQMRGSARAVLDFLPAELSARLDRVLELPVRKVTVRTLREKSGKFFRTSEATHLSLVGTDWAARIVREELEDSRVDQPLRID